MDEIDLYKKFNAITTEPHYPPQIASNKALVDKIDEHRRWLQSIPHEHPAPSTPYNVGVYIRYFNQTRYEDYLSYHKKQFADTIALCPKWNFVDFYIDEGASAPHMENSPELSRLIEDCMSGKVNLIITQKVSNFSKNINEVIFCSRMLAAMRIGIYFISEDIFTLASYYQKDLRDPEFLPPDDLARLESLEDELPAGDNND